MQNICVFSLFMLINICLFAQNPSDNEALVNVIVTDFKEVPRKGDIILFYGQKSKKTYSGTTDANGLFSINLPKGDTYIIRYREFTDDADYAEMEIPATTSRVQMSVEIKIETPKTFILENVFFDTGKASLKKESFHALNNLYEALKHKETLAIEIAGHTDNIGGEAYNLKLSEDRAQAVRQFLISKGIAAHRITAVGYGFSKPLADNDTEENRALNRRTEVKVLKE